MITNALLSGINSHFQALVELSEIWQSHAAPQRGDNENGDGFATTPSDSTIRKLRLQLFSDWLGRTPDEQRDEFRAYLSRAAGRWQTFQAFDQLIPQGAEQVERTVWEADTRMLPTAAQSPLDTDWRVMNVLTKIKESKGSIALSLKIFSGDLSLTERHVGRLFYECIGISFRRYLHAVRMAQAVGLLRVSAFPVKEIAPMLGYTDTCNFCNEFRTELGISPGRYRSELATFTH
jgi:AraC-like DNA-binding protein